jgi:hypothetical protein
MATPNRPLGATGSVAITADPPYRTKPVTPPSERSSTSRSEPRRNGLTEELPQVATVVSGSSRPGVTTGAT